VLEEVLGALDYDLVVPLQRGTDRDVRMKQVGPRDHRMDRKETAQRMSRKHSIRLHAVTLFNLGNEFRFDELEKLVGAAAGWKLKSAVAAGNRCRHVCGTQVARTVCIIYSDHNHLRHSPVSRQELDRAARVNDVSITISHVKHGIAQFVRFITSRYSHEDCSFFSKHSGVDSQSGNARRYLP